MADTRTAQAETKPDKNAVVTDLKELSRANNTRKIKFLGRNIEIKKLTLSECQEIQRKSMDTDENNQDQGFELIKMTIALGVPAAAEFSDDDFAEFPMDDLTKLAEEVMKLAGMSSTRGK
jgi:hypothetical protein